MLGRITTAGAPDLSALSREYAASWPTGPREAISRRRLRELADRRPLVLFNREASGLPSVVVDSVGGSRQIIDHLAALGHRRIAYLAGPPESWTDDERWRALSAGDAAGIEIVRHGHFLPTLDQGFAAADVGLGSGVSALIAFNDLVAIGALQRPERRGVDVPGEMGVVGTTTSSLRLLPPAADDGDRTGGGCGSDADRSPAGNREPAGPTGHPADSVADPGFHRTEPDGMTMIATMEA